MDIKITLDVTDRLLEVLERLSRFGQVNVKPGIDIAPESAKLYPFEQPDIKPGIGIAPEGAKLYPFEQPNIKPHIAKLDGAVKELAEVAETTEERDQRVKEGMFAAVKEFSPKPAGESRPPEAPAKRRRTKAQIEEDKENGLDDRFKQLSKEMPDASIDQIRDKMYAELAAANVAAPDADEPGAVSSPSPDEPGGGDDDWVPNWA